MDLGYYILLDAYKILKFDFGCLIPLIFLVCWYATFLSMSGILVYFFCGTHVLVRDDFKIMERDFSSGQPT